MFARRSYEERPRVEKCSERWGKYLLWVDRKTGFPKEKKKRKKEKQIRATWTGEFLAYESPP
jgi:hypothetical protein